MPSKSPMQSSPKVVGGGAKKILYTLNQLKRMGLRDSTKALRSANACKACGLGMGGQKGGMVNELGEFPSVCNKSVQAQSTDIQLPIPQALFAKHPVKEFRDLSGYDIEHLGRLANPIYKAKDSDFFVEVSWGEAAKLAAQQLKQTTPDRSFFYASGRSSNEAGFIFQLIARIYGTNNVNNCSYYCHQATSVALSNAVGTYTATVELKDLTACDLVFLIGANPASNHPRLIHKLKGVRERGGKIIVINPAKEPGLVKFAVPKSPKSLILGGTEIASEYLQPKIGSDVWLFKGLAKALLEKQSIDKEFIDKHTNGFAEFSRDLELCSWQSIEASCGISQDNIERIAALYAKSDRAIFAWGMGMTHHLNGVENIEYIANLALMRGMIGKPNAGLLPLRGHSNIQGIGTIGVKPVLPEDVYACIEKAFNITLPRAEGMDTLACLEAAHDKKMDFALMLGGNLFSASPDHAWTSEALDNIGLKVFLTTTLNHGHVNGLDSSAALVLPVAGRDEEHEATTQESMFNYVRLSNGGIQRLTTIKPETTVLAEIAEELFSDMELDFGPYKNHKNIRQAIADSIPGMEQLKDIDESLQEFHIPKRILHARKFNTADGRANFITQVSTPAEDNSTYPFTLMSVRSEGQFNSIIYEEKDSYRATDDRWCVLMSPSMIRELELEKGERVDLKSEHGEMLGLKVFPFDLPDQNLMAYYPEANRLIGRERDPRSKTPAFKSIAVALSKSNSKKITA